MVYKPTKATNLNLTLKVVIATFNNTTLKSTTNLKEVYAYNSTKQLIIIYFCTQDSILHTNHNHICLYQL